MTPEEWRRGMENEAASVEDQHWGGETRRLLRLQEARALLGLIASVILAGALELAWFSWDDGTFTGQLLGDHYSPGRWFTQVPWLMVLIGGVFGWRGAAPRLGLVAGLLALPLGWVTLAAHDLSRWHGWPEIVPPFQAPLLLGAWLMLGVWAGGELARRHVNIQRPPGRAA